MKSLPFWSPDFLSSAPSKAWWKTDTDEDSMLVYSLPPPELLCQIFVFVGFYLKSLQEALWYDSSLWDWPVQLPCFQTNPWNPFVKCYWPLSLECVININAALCLISSLYTLSYVCPFYIWRPVSPFYQFKFCACQFSIQILNNLIIEVHWATVHDREAERM